MAQKFNGRPRQPSAINGALVMDIISSPGR